MSPPPTRPKCGGTYCFWDGSRCHQHRHKTSCPLCNLNTLWNILMILARNVEQDRTHTRMITLTSVLLEFFPFVLFEMDFVSAL